MIDIKLLTAVESLREVVSAYYERERAIPGREASDAFNKLDTCILRAKSIAFDPIMRLEIGIIRLRRIVELWDKIESSDERDGYGFRKSCELAMADEMAYTLGIL